MTTELYKYLIEKVDSVNDYLEEFACSYIRDYKRNLMYLIITML